MSTDKPKKSPFSIHAMTESGIDQSDIWKGDFFNRSEITRKLTKLAQDEGMQDDGRRGYVISINGGWGTGKSFMLTRWHRELQEQGHVAIYFDAWQDDFIANPLVAIIGQLQDMLKQPSVQKIGIVQEATEKISTLAKGMNLNLSLGVASLSIPIGDLPKQGKDDIVQQYQKEKKCLEELKNCLRDLVMEIRKSTNFPLVFIIDELDRCRPTFALEILERVKHLFNLPGVVFVFGVNKSQLGKSVQSVYGDIDADEYLQKFFNLDLNLSVAKPSEYCKRLLKGQVHYGGIGTVFSDFYLPMLDFMGLSLRQVEYSAQLFKLSFLEIPDDYYSHYLSSLTCLILLKTIDLDLYSQFVRGECKCKDVVNKMADSWAVVDSHKDHKSDCQYELQCGIYLFAKDKEREVIADYLMHKAGDEYSVEGKDNPRDKLYGQFVADITKMEGVPRIRNLRKFFESTRSFDHQWMREIVSLLDLVEYKG